MDREEKKEESLEDQDLSLALKLSFKQEQERQRRQRQKESEQEKDQTAEIIQIKALKKQLLTKENENIALKRGKSEFEAANHRQRERILSLQTEIEQLRNQRDSTQIQYESSQKENQQLKV